MKHIVLLCVLFVSANTFAQAKIVKSTLLQTESIEINTTGLDDVTIVNSENDQLELELSEENPASHIMDVTNNFGITKISFTSTENFSEDTVFRKFITKRLQRASVIIKIPPKKNISIYGEVVGVNVKDYDGNVSIHIERGNIYLHKVKRRVEVFLFLGNVYVEVFPDTNLDIQTNKGSILLNDQYKSSPLLRKNKTRTTENSMKLRSVHANAFLKENEG